MKKIIKLYSFILLIILFNPLYSQVDITVPDTVLSLDAGDTFYLPVYTSSLDGLGVVSFQFDFHFDSTLLNFINYYNNGTLSSDFSFIAANEISPGFGRVAASGTSAINGEGILIYLEFKLLSNGISDIILTDFKFQDNGPTANITNGKITEINENSANIPQDYSLNNYPNPFNPETTIKYELPKQTYVKIEVFNILGQQIRTLINETQPAGCHQIKWNGRNYNGIRVNSGLYLYKLQAGDFTGIKKMVLLK